jgi:predicted GNAT family acetyltransferase
VSYTWLVIRRARHDEAIVLIAGIGAVKNHPAFRGRGLALSAIGAALGNGVEQGCDFGLLVCEDHFVPYYERSAWRL